jgi:DNA-binding transcriptional ArsR family regulator
MPADTLSETFAALADPTRRALIARLAQGEASVTELARPFLDDMSLPAVTKHLKVLERAGLITKGREAQWRPCRLNADPFRDVADWMQQYRQLWEESFDRLDAYLKTVTAKKKATAAKAKSPAKGKKHGRQK